MNINLLTEDELALLRETTDRAEHIVICCHRSPDGDAVGSSLGLADYLRSIGKEPVIAVPDAVPDFLHWLPGFNHIVRYDKHADRVAEAFAAADLIFCLDFNRPDRLDKMEELLVAATADKVLVDHHPEPDIEAKMTVSHPELSSTSEIVFRLIWQSGGFEAMTAKGAAALYCGMMTDTGAFTYNSSYPEIFFIISLLLTKGIDKDRIYRNVHNNYSQWHLRLVGYVLYQKLNVLADYKAAYFCLTRRDLQRFHFVRGDAEGLVNMPLQIKGLRLSISLREDTEKDNLVWVSLRSVGNLSCTALAEKYFNGGGHLNASGGRLYCSMEEAESIVRKAIVGADSLRAPHNS